MLARIVKRQPLVDSTGISLSLDHLFMALPAVFAVYYSIDLLFFRKQRVRSNRILAFFFLPFLFLQVFSLLADLELEVSKLMLFVFVPVALLWAPTFYLYTKALSKPRGLKLSLTKDLAHYWPAIIAMLINLPLMLIIMVVGKTADWYKPAVQVLTVVTMSSLMLLWPLQNIIYIVLSYRMYLRHKRTYVEFFSFDEGINLRWMRNTIWVYAVFFVLVVTTSIPDNPVPDIVFNILILAYMLYVGYNGTKQIDVYSGLLTDRQRVEAEQQDIPAKARPQAKPIAAQPATAASNGAAPEKYSGSSLKDETREALKAQLLAYMEAENPYLNVQLTIFDIAKALDVNNKYVSQVINQDLGINFIGFINQYRVEAAKKLLVDPEMSNFTIEGLAGEAGFKSKSTFNIAFKKFTGKTPSQYRKEQLAAPEKV